MLSPYRASRCSLASGHLAPVSGISPHTREMGGCASKTHAVRRRRRRLRLQAPQACLAVQGVTHFALSNHAAHVVPTCTGSPRCRYAHWHDEMSPDLCDSGHGRGRSLYASNCSCGVCITVGAVRPILHHPRSTRLHRGGPGSSLGEINDRAPLDAGWLLNGTTNSRAR